MAELTQQMIDNVGRELIERGLIIEAGWVGYTLMFKVPHAQFESERRAFFAGAQHLLTEIMNHALDVGAEPTDADMRHMDNIAKELKQFERILDDTVRKMGN